MANKAMANKAMAHKAMADKAMANKALADNEKHFTGEGSIHGARQAKITKKTKPHH